MCLASVKQAVRPFLQLVNMWQLCLGLGMWIIRSVKKLCDRDGKFKLSAMSSSYGCRSVFHHISAGSWTQKNGPGVREEYPHIMPKARGCVSGRYSGTRKG